MTNERDMADEGDLMKRRREFDKEYDSIKLRNEIDEMSEITDRILERMKRNER